jgi:hypothetical protein
MWRRESQESRDVKPATLWYRKAENEFEYNHLEDGHCLSNTPTPKCDCTWRKELVYLTDTFPTQVVQLDEAPAEFCNN